MDINQRIFPKLFSLKLQTDRQRISCNGISNLDFNVGQHSGTTLETQSQDLGFKSDNWHWREKIMIKYCFK